MIVMIVMVMVIIMAMRDAHARRDRRTRHPAHNATDQGPPTAPPETAPTPTPLNLSPVVEQAARLSAAKPVKTKLSRKDIDISRLLPLSTIPDRLNRAYPVKADTPLHVGCVHAGIKVGIGRRLNPPAMPSSERKALKR
jgi:hypothetical protein